MQHELHAKQHAGALPPVLWRESLASPDNRDVSGQLLTESECTLTSLSENTMAAPSPVDAPAAHTSKNACHGSTPVGAGSLISGCFGSLLLLSSAHVLLALPLRDETLAAATRQGDFFFTKSRRVAVPRGLGHQKDAVSQRSCQPQSHTLALTDQPIIFTRSVCHPQSDRLQPCRRRTDTRWKSTTIIAATAGCHLVST
jgi:hypothetical protein